jgi:hypothetical protein
LFEIEKVLADKARSLSITGAVKDGRASLRKFLDWPEVHGTRVQRRHRFNRPEQSTLGDFLSAKALSAGGPAGPFSGTNYFMCSGIFCCNQRLTIRTAACASTGAVHA